RPQRRREDRHRRGRPQHEEREGLLERGQVVAAPPAVYAVGEAGASGSEGGGPWSIACLPYSRARTRKPSSDISWFCEAAVRNSCIIACCTTWNASPASKPPCTSAAKTAWMPPGSFFSSAFSQAASIAI